MKVFLPISTQQILKVRTRKEVYFGSLVLRQELKDISTTISDIPVSFLDGYALVAFQHPFVESETYEITLLEDETTEVIWKGKAFITAQTPSAYKMNA
jgi:hypothetical protein